MEIQSNNPLWSEQVKAEYNAQSSSSNVEENNNSNNLETGNGSKYGKQCEVNKALVLNNTLLPHEVSKAIDQHILNTQEEVYEINWLTTTINLLNLMYGMVRLTLSLFLAL